MKNIITPINDAEAICIPLFDGKLFNFDEFVLDETGGEGGSFTQSWDCCFIKSNAKDFSIKWQGNLIFNNYDAIRFAINYAKHLLLTGTAVVNGKEVLLFENVEGDTVPIEPTSKPLIKDGETAEVTEFTLKFHCTGGCIGEHIINFYWVGLLQAENEHLIEDGLPKYDVNSWDGLINFDGKPGINNNLYFNEHELNEMKKRLNEPVFAQMAELLKQKAEKWESFVPENEIREYLAESEHLYRYVRVRDRNRTPLEVPIEMLAIAGYIFDNPKWTLMAARMIMSAVHTPKWFEGPQGCLDGSTWHHVCFTEDHVLSSIASAIGFMGNVFTEKGHAMIMDAIEKAWKWVNICCEAPGYRWFMNQGIVGNRGRIIGAYSLYKNGRDYENYVKTSYQDHTTIVNNYLNDEGHCTEGGYYQYSFSSSIPLWILYANYKNTEIINILPKKFIKSIKYVEASISSNSELCYALPLGAGGYAPYNVLILAFLASVCGYQKAYGYLKNRVNAGVSASGLDIMLLLKFMPKDFPEVAQEDKNFIVFKEGGLLSYDYAKPFKGKLMFQCERNPMTGHYNEDRGSIILEAYGKTLLLDLGSTNYSNLMSAFMGCKEYHNLAYPENLDMKIRNNIAFQSSNEAGIGSKAGISMSDFCYPGPTLDVAQETETGVKFGADLTPIYGDEVISARRDGELALSGKGGNVSLLDKWKFNAARILKLNFLSFSPWTIHDSFAVSKIEDVEMKISFSEKSNLKLTFSQDDAMADCNLKKVYTLRLSVEAAEEVEVCSNIWFEKI